MSGISAVKEDSASLCHEDLRILLGITGSVAAVKAPELICSLISTFGGSVRVNVVLTKGGNHFWEKASAYDITSWGKLQEYMLDPCRKQVEVYRCEDEWKVWERIGDPVEHIVLRDWADVCVVAPLSAHTLAKIANGLCDDTLSCIIRAWNFGNQRNSNSIAGKPMILAPAMNTAMWEHPITAQQLATFESFGRNTISSDGLKCDSLVRIVEPQSKKLACGDVGVGAMADVHAIVNVIHDVLSHK